MGASPVDSPPLSLSSVTKLLSYYAVAYYAVASNSVAANAVAANAVTSSAISTLRTSGLVTARCERYCYDSCKNKC